MEDEETFGAVLTITQTQYDTLTTDPEAFQAWAELPDGVTCTSPHHLGRITNPAGDIIGYAAAHPALEAELMAEVLTDNTLLEDIKTRRASNQPDWAVGAREAARAKVASKTPAQRKKARDDNNKRLTPTPPAPPAPPS